VPALNARLGVAHAAAIPQGLEAELKQGVAEEASQRRMDSQLQDYREGYTK